MKRPSLTTWSFSDSPSSATETFGPDFPTQSTTTTVEVMERKWNYGKGRNHQTTLQEYPLLWSLVNRDIWLKWWIKHQKKNQLGRMDAGDLWLLSRVGFFHAPDRVAADVGVLQFTSASRLPGNQLRVSVTLHTSSHTTATPLRSVFRTPPRCLCVLNMLRAALRSYPGFTCHWWSCTVPSGQPNWG